MERIYKNGYHSMGWRHILLKKNYCYIDFLHPILASHRDTVIRIIKDYYDVVFEEEVHRPALGYEFCIDTDDTSPVYYRPLSYGVYESKVTSSQVQLLKFNEMIRDCLGSWGSMIILARIFQQEKNSTISTFVFHIYISYRALNVVTKNFALPIPSYQVDVVEFSRFQRKFVLHQIREPSRLLSDLTSRDRPRKKYLFNPRWKKEQIVVIPFGLKITPTFYTTMMKDLEIEYNVLFGKDTIVDLHNPRELVSHTSHLKPHPVKFVHSRKIIIDGILLYSSNVYTWLRYFACVAILCVECHVSFKFSNYEFFKPQVEYVGYDLIQDEICPAEKNSSFLRIE